MEEDEGEVVAGEVDEVDHLCMVIQAPLLSPSCRNSPSQAHLAHLAPLVIPVPTVHRPRDALAVPTTTTESSGASTNPLRTGMAIRS
jgi:hypothetical protein